MPPGPPPKREAERRRARKPPIPLETIQLDNLIAQEVEIPVAPETWHPIASMWYASLTTSGQAVFYEPSDWSTAFLVAELLHRELSPQAIVVGEKENQRVEMHVIPMKGASLTAMLRAMTSLLVMEGDRRRLLIELERKRQTAELPVDVTNIAEQRQRRLQQ